MQNNLTILSLFLINSMLKSPLITSTGSSSVKSFHLSSSKISNFISPSFFSSFLNLQKFSGSSFLNHLNSVIQLNLDDPTISNQDFIGNTLFLEDHTKIVSCVFANNTSPTSGGAISVRRYNCSIEIHNSDFSLNNAFIGGAVYISSFYWQFGCKRIVFFKKFSNKWVRCFLSRKYIGFIRCIGWILNWTNFFCVSWNELYSYWLFKILSKWRGNSICFKPCSILYFKFMFYSYPQLK